MLLFIQTTLGPIKSLVSLSFFSVALCLGHAFINCLYALNKDSIHTMILMNVMKVCYFVGRHSKKVEVNLQVNLNIEVKVCVVSAVYCRCEKKFDIYEETSLCGAMCRQFNVPFLVNHILHQFWV